MHHPGTAVLVLTAATLLTACASTSSSTTAGTSAASVSGSATSMVRTMPNLIGKGLQTAQDDAQAAGLSSLTSHDATGRARHQILDRDWKVCFQAPAAGAAVNSGTTVDFGVVKLDETCPATDQGTQVPSAAAQGQAMPDLIGKSLNVARDSLPSDTSITSSDISGQGRMII